MLVPTNCSLAQEKKNFIVMFNATFTVFPIPFVEGGADMQGATNGIQDRWTLIDVHMLEWNTGQNSLIVK